MASVYPGVLDTFTTKQNKQDDFDASHMNDVQAAIVATQTELGVDVAGSATNLVARLAKALADNGAMQQGTAFPTVSLVDGQMFYRTDENVMYIYNGSSWDAQGQSLSNLVWCWAGMDDYNSGTAGAYLGTDETPDAADLDQYFFVGTNASAYDTVLKFKYKKLAGVNTISCYSRSWTQSTGESKSHTVQVTINTTTTGDTGAVDSGTPTWNTVFTVDVSGLSDGTVYEGTVDLKYLEDGNVTYLSNIIMFAS